ncbi:hypothetical protein SKA15_15260, partial [Enterococcus faecium]
SFLLLSFSIILPYLIVDLKLCNRTEEILANYKEQNIKTLELIKKNIKYYDPLLANKENIDKLLNAIADSDVRSPRIDELKEEILMYKELF